MDPVEHYEWLGRRLGRLPTRAATRADSRPLEARSIAAITDQYANESISAALKRLCAWLFPDEGRTYGMSARQCYDLMANNFWNDESNGTVRINPNGKLLVD